jgi:methionyl-tRNA formyltransferase
MQTDSGQPPLRLAFAGTPEFAVAPLKALIDHGDTPCVVLTQPDRPSGRGRKLTASPVKQAALEAGIEVWQPERLSGVEIQAQLNALELDLMVVVAYGLILPMAVLRIPRYGCWNIHASLLPRWRGAAPIQRAIEAGDEHSGVCIMQMAAGLDTGPVYLRVPTPLASDETGGSLHDRLAEMGADALVDCIDRLRAGDMPEPVAQDPDQATYARKLDKSEAQIDWQSPAIEIERRVRAFNPWPVCWCEIDGARLRVWSATAHDGNPGATPGTIISAGPQGIDVATPDGWVSLQTVQRAGGQRMPVSNYLNAHPVRTGV